MSSGAAFALCVLWEHELRTASKLLAEAYAMPDETDEQREALGVAQGSRLSSLRGSSTRPHRRPSSRTTRGGNARQADMTYRSAASPPMFKAILSALTVVDLLALGLAVLLHQPRLTVIGLTLTALVLLAIGVVVSMGGER